MKTDQIRLFFALVPTGPVRESIAELQRSLDHPGRAIPAANFHITLAFLGSVKIQRLEQLHKLGNKLVMKPFVISLDELGWFRGARVGWIGPSQVPEALLKFQSDLGSELQNAHFDLLKRPWKAHLSLYRKMRTPFDTIAPEAIRWQVNSFSLVVSEPSESGVRYEEMQRWNCVPA